MWYWCQKHGVVESEEQKCGSLDRLGPYDSPEAAANWKATAEARNERWEEEDEEWEGDGQDD